jgi:molybdopterin converting factor small subunit
MATERKPGTIDIYRSIPLPIVAIIVTASIGLATFAANFIFATKSEVLQQRTEAIQTLSAVENRLTQMKGEVSLISKDIDYIRAANKSQREQSKAIDTNLRRLMIRRGVRPVAKKPEEEMP